MGVGSAAQQGRTNMQRPRKHYIYFIRGTLLPLSLSLFRVFVPFFSSRTGDWLRFKVGANMHKLGVGP